MCGYVYNKSSLIFYLATHNGSKKFRTYKLGENDYYWIHSSIDDRFWIIPEIELYKREYISDSDKISNSKSIRIRVNSENEYGVREWLKDYEYDYLNADKDKILNLFN